VSRRERLAIGVLTAAGVLVRLPGLNSGLWYDEFVTLVEFVRLPFARLIATFPVNNNHPLYSLLAHASAVQFGESPWSLRLPALVFGVLSIPMLYRLALDLTTRTEAMLAAVVLTFSYHHVWFSQNARGYTALLFWTLLATWLFNMLVTAPGSRTRPFAYGLVAALGIYTHLTMIFVVTAHALLWGWWWLRVKPEQRMPILRSAFLALASGAALAFLLYAPMIGQVVTFFTRAPEPKAAAVATPAWALQQFVNGLHIGLGGVGALLALGLIAAGGLSFLRKTPLVAALFIMPGIITVAATVVLGAPLRPRFLLSLLGFAILMLVRGAVEAGVALGRWTRSDVPRRLVAPALCGTIAVVSVVALRYNYDYPKQDFDGAMRFIEQHKSGGERVGTGGLATYPYQHYYELPWPEIKDRSQFDSLRAESARSWLVYSFPEYMDRDLVAGIQQYCHPERAFHGSLAGGDVVVCSIN
jgi:mannosyltransferase